MHDFDLCRVKGWVVVFVLQLVAMDLLGFGVDFVGHSIWMARLSM